MYYMKHLKQLFCLIVLLVACSAQQLLAPTNATYSD